MLKKQSHGFYIGAMSVLVFISISFLVTPVLNAAPNPGDSNSKKVQYKKYRESLKTRTQEGIKTFSNQTLSEEERLRGCKDIGYLFEPNQQRALLEIFKDTKESDQIRTCSLLRLQVKNDPDLINAISDLIIESDNGSESLKILGVRRLQAFRSAGVNFKVINKPLEIAIENQKLVKLRNRAMSYLAMRGNAKAVEVLTKSLEQPDKALYSKSAAINYLLFANPTKSVEAVKKFLNDEKPEVQISAIEFLSHVEPQKHLNEVRAVLMSSSDNGVQESCLRFFSRGDSEFAMKNLVGGYLNSKNDNLRLEAVKYFSDSSIQDKRKYLGKSLLDANPRVRFHTIKALKRDNKSSKIIKDKIIKNKEELSFIRLEGLKAIKNDEEFKAIAEEIILDNTADSGLRVQTYRLLNESEEGEVSDRIKQKGEKLKKTNPSGKFSK